MQLAKLPDSGQEIDAKSYSHTVSVISRNCCQQNLVPVACVNEVHVTAHIPYDVVIHLHVNSEAVLNVVFG